MAGKISLFETEPEYIRDIELDPDLEDKERILRMSVKEIELTVRASNCLEAAGIETIGDLVEKTEAEMLKFRNFGKKSLEEIVTKLKKYDLELGTDVQSIYDKIKEARSRGIISPKPINPDAETEAPEPKAPAKKEKAATATPRKPVPKKKVKNAT